MRYNLQQGISVPLPAQLLSVVLQGVGGQPQPELDAVLSDGAGQERPAEVLTRYPGMLVLSVADPVLIRMRPPQGQGVFPPQSVYSLVIGPEGDDADKAILKSVDASGLRTRDLVTLVPVGEEVIVSTVAQTVDAALPPLADKARVAAREVLGVATVPRERAVGLSVAVDGSASMRPFVDSGAVERSLELLMGLGQVICPSQRVPAVVCGQALNRLTDQPLDGFAAPVSAAAARLVPSVGFRSDLIPDAGEQALTYVITDAVPADLTTARKDLLHLVVLSDGGEDAAHPLPGAVGATVLPPGLDWSALGQGDVYLMVTSLLSAYQRRVAGAHA